MTGHDPRLGDQHPTPPIVRPSRPERSRLKTVARYGLPGLVLVVGCIVLFILSHEAAVIGVVMIVAFAIKVIFLGEVFRIGFGADTERDDEDAARRYLTENGRWPDDRPPPAGRS